MSVPPPLFGEPSDELPIVPRPGSYAIAFDGGSRIATVFTSTGPHLPGGGRDPGETDEDALHRELAEEIGRSARVLRVVCRADVYGTSVEEGACFLKQGTFFEVELGAPVEGAVPEYELRWIPVERFLAESPDGSAVWAVRRARDPCGPA